MSSCTAHTCRHPSLEFTLAHLSYLLFYLVKLLANLDKGINFSCL
jgi:hypothetical protein